MSVILVLAVLKKNYTNLCHCLPQNNKKISNKLRLMGCPADILSDFTNLPTTDLINDAIIGSLMVARIKSDVQALQFCDDMDNWVDSNLSKRHIEILRNGN